MNHKIPIPPVSRVSWRNGAILLGAAALVLLVYVLVSRFSVTIDALPELELGGFEEPVRAKLEALRAEIEAHPRSAAAWGKYAMNLYIHDFKTEALPVYIQAARLDAKDFRWPYLCAIAHTETNSPEDMQWYERSLKLNPTYVPLLVRYGHTLATSGDATRAQGLFQKATEADPPSSHAYVELAQIALTEGQDQAARDYLLEAVRVAPYNRRAYEFLAEIYRRTNQPAEAERALAQAQSLPRGTGLQDSLIGALVEEGISSYWCNVRADHYMRNGQYNRAVREFRLALTAKPDAEGHNNLGAAFQHLGRFEEAAEQYRQALGIDSTYISALSNLGVVYYETGKLDEAIASLERVVEIKRPTPDVYLNLGTFYKQAGRLEAALHAFRQGVALAAEDLRFAYQLGWLLAAAAEQALRNGEEAVRLAEKVCEASGYRKPGTLDLLAAAYAETGEFEKAVQTAARSYRLAMASGQTQLASQIQTRMKLYETEQPYRE